MQPVKTRWNSIPVFKTPGPQSNTMKVIARPKTGELILYLGRQDEEWRMLQVLVGGVTGWVYENLVELVK